MELEKPLAAADARELLREAPGILVVDKAEDGGYITPVETAGEDATYVSRIREDGTVENGLALWVVADNLRKGAALNAIPDRRASGQPQSYQAQARSGLSNLRQLLQPFTETLEGFGHVGYRTAD